MEQKYPIRVAASKTGLSTHVIRMWERRYGAVEPDRTDTKRRLYSDKDIQRLTLLRRATQAGANIGQIANLPNDDLRELVSSYEQISPSTTPRASSASNAGYYLKLATDAIEALYPKATESALLQASVALGRAMLFEKVLKPLLSHIGDEWSSGNLKVAHEHLASSVVRSFLGHMAESSQTDDKAPLVVITTPAGQMHEFGALMAAVTAANSGWRITYLGPNTPAEDIAGAARQASASAVALSIIYPPDDPRLAKELSDLRRMLGNDIVLMVGGRSRNGYRETLEDIDAVILDDFSGMVDVLTSSRLLSESRRN